jgi:hypothetical protein
MDVYQEEMMTVPRQYSVREIKELVDLLRHDPDMAPEKFAGMLELVQLLAHFEYMTDEDVEAEVRNAYKKIKF